MSTPNRTVAQLTDVIIGVLKELQDQHHVRVDGIHVNWQPYTLGSRAQMVHSLALDMKYEV